jgi:hypothetical protein
MLEEQSRRELKKPRLSVNPPYPIFLEYIGSPIDEVVILPLLTKAPGSAWKSRTINDCLALIEENFDKTKFVADHAPFINDVLPSTQEEIDSVSAAFRKQGTKFLQKDFQKLYSRLRGSTINAERTRLDFSSEDFNLGTKFTKELFVRSCFWQLFYVIELMILLKKSTFRISGTSGIGKTRFGLFFMCLAAKRGKILLYQFSEDSVYFLAPGISFSLLPDEMGTWLINNRKIDLVVDYYIFDSNEVCTPLPSLSCVSEVTIMITSPNNERFKYFEKENPTVVLIMKMTTEEEIIEMKDAIPAFANISPERIAEQLKIYGPVPRSILENAESGVTMLWKAISLTRLNFLFEVLRRRTHIWEDDESVLFYHLAHINSSDFSDTRASYSFASDYILEEINKRDRVLLSTALFEWIQTPETADASAVGNLFDSYGHGLFVKGKLFEVVPLSASTHRKYGPTLVHSVAGEPFQLDFRNVQAVLPLPAWAEIMKDTYYIHKKVNMKSADCIFIHDDTLIVLQFTVSSSHPIKGTGLSDIITQVTNKFNDVIKVRFVFVSLDFPGCIVKIQPLHIAGKNAKYSSLDAIPENIRNHAIHTTQYMMKIACNEFGAQPHVVFDSLLG